MSFASVVSSYVPYAWYRCNDSSGTTLADSSGNNRNGTITGAVTLQSTSLTTDGNHSILNTTNSAINLTNSGPGLTNAPFSLAFLWKPGTLTNAYIAGGQFGDAYHFWQLIEDPSNNAISLVVSNSSNGGPAPIVGSSTNALAGISANGSAVLLVVTYDGSGNWNVTKNNDPSPFISITTQAQSTITPNSGTNSLIVGSFYNKTDLSEAGNYQDIILFNTAISQSEINDIFAQTGIVYTPIVYALPSVTWTPVCDYTPIGGPIEPAPRIGAIGNGFTDDLGYVWSIDSQNQIRQEILTTDVQKLGLLERLGTSDLMVDCKQVVRFTLVQGEDIYVLSRLSRNSADTASTAYMGGYVQSTNSVQFLPVVNGVNGAQIGGSFYALSSALTIGQAYDIEFVTQQFDSSTTVLQIRILDTQGSVLFTKLVHDTTVSLQNASGGQGYLFYAYNYIGSGLSYPQKGIINRIRTFSDSTTSALKATSARCVNLPDNVKINIVPPVGGTAPYSYQIYRGASISSSTSGYTSIYTGANTTYNDVPPDNGVYYYIVKATDSVGASVQYVATAGQLNSSLMIAAIGDSRTFGVNSILGLDPVLQLGQILAARIGLANISTNNQGIAGYTSAQWASGTSTLANSLSIIKNQAQTMPSGTKVFVQLMLGANDALISFRVTPTQFLANLTGIVNAIKSAAIPGFAGVVLHCSFYAIPYRYPTQNTFDEQSDLLIQQYNAELASLADNVTVFMGDTAAFDYFAANAPALLDTTDGVHPNSTGYNSLASLWANAYARILSINTTVTPPTNHGGVLAYANQPFDYDGIHYYDGYPVYDPNFSLINSDPNVRRKITRV